MGLSPPVSKVRKAASSGQSNDKTFSAIGVGRKLRLLPLTTANLAVAQASGFHHLGSGCWLQQWIKARFPTHKRQMLLQQFALLGQAATPKEACCQKTRFNNLHVQSELHRLPVEPEV